MKVQNKKGFEIVSKLFLLAAVLVLQMVILGQTTITANAQGTAKVTADSGKIRKTPDTSADVLGSVKENDKLTVIAQTTASDGYTWYKVFVDDLLAKLECLPDKSILDSDMFALDGVFHAIRVFESGMLKKEVVYDDAEEIAFNEKSNSAGLKSFYSELYLKIEKIIGCGDK